MFALYVMIYTAGRGWIETLRIDTVELNNVLGLRWGVWMSIVLFAGAAAYFVVDRPAAPAARHPRALAVRRRAAVGRGDRETDAETVEAAAEHDENTKDPSQTPPE